MDQHDFTEHEHGAAEDGNKAVIEGWRKVDAGGGGDMDGEEEQCAQTGDPVEQEREKTSSG
jgi:hypothetical protein